MQPAVAHREAVRMPLVALAATLETVLSRRVTAYLAGVKDVQTVSRWAHGDITTIRNDAVEQRLRAALTVVTLLREAEDDRTVKSWFVSLNPHLGDMSPAQAIRHDRGKDAIEAARVFVAAN